MKQMLTPAPDVAAISWKRAQLRAENYRYSNVKPERLQRDRYRRRMARGPSDQKINRRVTSGKRRLIGKAPIRIFPDEKTGS
jgi:hypothetical protein